MRRHVSYNGLKIPCKYETCLRKINSLAKANKSGGNIAMASIII